MLRQAGYFVGACLLASTACGRSGAPPPRAETRAAAGSQVRQLADAFLAGYFDRNPDAVTLYGVPGRHHDRLPDNSLEALKTWQAKEDAWLAQIRAIDSRTIDDASLRATAAIVREALEASAGARVCRTELWT